MPTQGPLLRWLRPSAWKHFSLSPHPQCLQLQDDSDKRYKTSDPESTGGRRHVSSGQITIREEVTVTQHILQEYPAPSYDVDTWRKKEDAVVTHRELLEPKSFGGRRL